MADLFSGVGKVSRHVRSMGFTSRQWEILKGPDHDLTSPAVLRKLKLDISSGRVLAAMIATPCTSFSRARDRTRVIRSQTHPWGCNLAGASERDLQSLELGNATAWATIQIIKQLNKYRVPWIMENPSTSRIWFLPELQA